VENDWLALAPILVENLGAVFGGDRAHVISRFAGGMVRMLLMMIAETGVFPSISHAQRMPGGWRQRQ
jgi:hypothetical protein